MRKMTDAQYGDYLLSLFREVKPDNTNGLVVVAVWIALMILTISLLCGAAHAEPINLVASFYSEAALKRDSQYALTKNIMANGEIFRDEKMVAASWDFPLNQKVRVTNKATGKSIIVKVADRTARRFASKRIDLSKGAMLALGGQQALIQGLIPVEVTEVTK